MYQCCYYNARLLSFNSQQGNSSMIRLCSIPRSLLSVGSHKVSDWEYVTQIHKSLKDNKINEAVNFLINSHLDGIVLDRQTFHNVYLKMSQAKVALSYQELAYKLYRESFTPHILMIEWMKNLSQTKNKKLYEQLQKDFKQLNMQMPANSTTKQEIKVDHTSPANERQAHKTDASKVKTPVKQNQQKTSSPVAAVSESAAKSPAANYSLNTIKIEQVAHSIEQFVKLLQNSEIKISIHDVELQMKNQQDDLEEDEQQDNEKVISQYQLENNHDSDVDRLQEVMDQLNYIVSSVSKVKIGKIDFSSTSIVKDKDPNNNNNNNNSNNTTSNSK